LPFPWQETLSALVRALKAFKGAVLTISHNSAFVEQVLLLDSRYRS